MSDLSAPAQKEVWELVRQINAAWQGGQPERLLELFHDRMAIVGTSGNRYGVGRLACVESYRNFIASAQVTLFEETDPSVDVFKTVAIVCYRFEIEYVMGGETHKETGCDTFVFEHSGGKWLAVWRQLSDQTTSRRSNAKLLFAPSIVEAHEPQGPSFLVDVCNVVGYVFDFGLEHFVECDQAAFAMHASTSPGRFRQRAQYHSHLGTHPFHEGELGIQVVLVVSERCREPALIVADQQGPFLGDDPLHAVAPGLFAVDQVAYDLEGAPLAGDRPCLELGGAHIGNGPSQLDWAVEICVNLLAKT